MHSAHAPAAIVFLSHGGGPLPLLGDPGHAPLVQALQDMASRLPRPKAILVISAHWEEAAPTLTAAAAPELLYDYYGFPPESYAIRYPCPGAPALAQHLHAVLQGADLAPALNTQRGLDHGVFVPLKILYPQADIPCLQLSLLRSLDPLTHLRMGQALRNADLRDVLVIGSGFSFHNMRAFFSPDTPETRAMNLAFEAWRQDTCGNPALSPAQRRDRLKHWEQAPHARYCHPREEHLLPLHVCQALAEGPCVEQRSVSILGKQASLLRW